MGLVLLAAGVVLMAAALSCKKSTAWLAGAEAKLSASAGDECKPMLHFLSRQPLLLEEALHVTGRPADIFEVCIKG